MAKTAHELIRERFDVEVQIRREPVVGTVELTDTLILRNNANRYAVVFINLGANPVFLTSGGRPATTTDAVRLAPTGGFLSLTLENEFTWPSLEHRMIATGGTSAIAIIEVVGI